MLNNYQNKILYRSKLNLILNNYFTKYTKKTSFRFFYFLSCILLFVFYVPLNTQALFTQEKAQANTFFHIKKAHAQEVVKPFNYNLEWSIYKEYQVLTIQLTSHNSYYTYAPNQEGVYPTSIDILHTDHNPIQPPPILYPVGTKKSDPFNPDIQIYAYENQQYIFLLFPTNFLEEQQRIYITAENTKKNNTTSQNNVSTDNLELLFSFLACTSEHCLPQKETIAVPIQNIDIHNLKSIEDTPYFTEFHTLFIEFSQESLTHNITKQTPKVTKAKQEQRTHEQINNLTPDNIHEKKDIIENISTDNYSQNSEKSADKDIIEDIIYDFEPQPYNSSLEVHSLYKALLFGLLAGFILNFMPCVLPVIGLKIRSFLQSEEEPQKRLATFREHNFFFALGILTWFLILGLFLGVLGFSWGQLFQNPVVVLTLTLFIFAMSLSLFGIFHLPIFGTKIANIPSKKYIQSEKFSAFASGLLATLLATPCSGPLLGAVLGYSLTQPLPILLTIFLSMGIGMGLPYFVFAVRPSLVRFMPKAGNWLNNMELILGFFLIATSIYLYSLLPNDWRTQALILAFFLAISCTLWGKIGSFHSKGIKKMSISTICVLLVLLPSYFLFQTKEKNLWIDFTPQSFQEHLGKEVLVLKFTADWCPTCKVLEHTVFTEENMQTLSNNVIFMYVDLTEFEEPKQNLLKALDSVSIPLLAIFPKGERAQKPIIIRDMYTLTQVKNAITLAE